MKSAEIILEQYTKQEYDPDNSLHHFYDDETIIEAIKEYARIALEEQRILDAEYVNNAFFMGVDHNNFPQPELL